MSKFVSKRIAEAGGNCRYYKCGKAPCKIWNLEVCCSVYKDKMVSHDLDFESAGGSKLKLDTVMVIGLERKLSVFAGDIYLMFKIFLQHELNLRTGNKAML